MLLPYEYEALLINPNNRSEVVSILERLGGSDILTPEEATERRALVERLRTIGEAKIYERLVEQI